MLDRSPIEQALIDGVLYWDKIGENWHRLLHRTSMEVWGHYRLTRYWRDRWAAVIRQPIEGQEFDTAAEARQWIETAAQKRLSTQEKSNV